MTVTYRKYGIRLSHVWFASEREILDGSFKNDAGDLIFLHGASCAPPGGYLYTVQHTLIKDLSLSEEELFMTFSKVLRKRIRRAKRENSTIEFYESKDVLMKPELLDVCRTFYEGMFSDKGMNVKFNTKLALQYCKLDALLVMLAKIDGENAGFCADIYQGENARVWVSAFDFRGRTGEEQQIISRAHRLLNWEKMLWHKAHGVRYLDMGGVNSFDNPNSIAWFKMEFARENPVTYSNYLVPKNIIGKLALKIFMRGH